VKKFSLGFIALLQATGITLYCFLVALLMFNGAKWFGPMPNFLGPVLFLMLFVVSAAICAIIFGGYAFILFWEEKKTRLAIKLVAYTTAWLALFTLIILTLLLSPLT
jgi:hypothetical protein